MTLSDFDLYLFGTGAHAQAYDKLGAHVAEEEGTQGVRFAVWAPNAQAASVVGDFNGWKAGADPLSPTGDSGIWQGFVPDISPGEAYKYALRPRDVEWWIEKA